ncbi:hypothetical protein ACP4OV_028169 [Aristida adscensionis]
MDGVGGEPGLAGGEELAALRDALAELDATAPRRVCRKPLAAADVDRSQMRLLVRRAPPGNANAGAGVDALAAFLTADEADRVHVVDRRSSPAMDDPHSWWRRDEEERRRGLEVPAYDRHGRRYELWLRVQVNGAYRFCGGGWGRFVADNHVAEAVAEMGALGREVEVELWAFRSPELLPLRRGGGSDHPDGAMGIAILVRGQQQ